ncbi:hypothetical protein ACHAO5_003984 [Verticillium nonalfalfae]
METVFSTGLLVLEPTVIVREGVAIPIQSTFDAQGYQIPQLGPAAAQLYYAINFQGLPYPTGTSADTVVPEIGLPDSPAQANYSVVTRGAKVGFECDLLPIQNATQVMLPWYSINGMFWTIDVATPECNISSAIVAAGPDSNHYVQENATQNFQGVMQDYTCNNGVEYSRLHDMTTNYTEEQVVNASMPHRVLLTMADLRFTPMNRSLTRPERIYIQDFTAALCTYHYTLDDFEVESLVESGSRKQAVMQATHHQGAHELEIPGFPKSMLGKSVEYATRLLDVGTGGVDFVLSTPVTSLFRLMTIKQNRTTIGAFMDPDLLISTASDVFKGVGTQLLGTMTLNPAIASTEKGSVAMVEDRLHVTELSTAFMYWLQYFVIPDDESVTHVGKASLLGWFDDTKIITWGDGATDTSPGSGSGMGVEGITLGDSGCPSMAFTLGTIRAGRSGRSEKARQFAVESDLATLVCYQRADQVMANVTFSAPSMTIDTLVPPILDESTRTVLADPTTNTTSFAYPINRLLLSIANSLTANTTESDGIASLDGFSRALLSGRGAQTIETLAGEANVDNLRKAATRLYKTYMAQAISANMRRDAELLPAYEGRLTSSARRRLQQNNGPKIALQVMLGLMVVCIIASRLLMDVRTVLPHDPCSIAGVATLLAGSDMVTMVEGSEWEDDKGLETLFRGKRFGLDWWGKGVGRRFGIDVECEAI